MFLENLKTIALQVLILYLIAGIGFVTDKVGIFKQADGKRLIDLLFNVILPIAIIHTFMTMEYTEEHVRGIFVAFLCAFATHLFGMIVSKLTFRKRSLKERGIYHYATVLSNAAFLALPLAKSVIGNEGIFYCSVYVAVFNIIAFTWGISEISGKEAKIDFKKLILNPGSISVIVGLPLFFLNLDIPYFIEYPMEVVGNCNSPLAMIVFGTFFANANFKNLFVKKELYFVSLLRLIVIPICMLGLFRLCGVKGDLLTAMIISSSAPVATNTAMYAAKYDNDTALGSELAAQSSVLSVITMPVIVALAAVV
ncbi:MAG: AEC family transporter [Eubacteriales bacterium]|nr:AEC family transporter [Eubacteriales bacterium]